MLIAVQPTVIRIILWDGCGRKKLFEGLNQFEMKGNMQGNGDDQTLLHVLASEDFSERTTIEFDWKNGTLAIHREHSSVDPRVDRRSASVEIKAMRETRALDFHLFVDRSVVCLFVANGAHVLTMRVYPSNHDHGVFIEATGGASQLTEAQGWELAANTYRNLMDMSDQKQFE